MKKVAAFFDIDGTLYREGLITEVFKKLIKCEIIKPERWYNEVRPEYIKWDRREGNYDNYLLKMAKIYTEAIKGLHRYQVEFIAKNVVEQKGDRVYTFTRDRIKWHKSKGHIVITISGSPIELVKEMSLKHGFDDYRGTIYAMDENEMYTGEVIPMWDSVSKKKAIEKLTKQYDIDLENSYAYGDTAGDFSMFKMIKYPVCVNPTKELLNKVLNDKEVKEKIRIIVERKDVIYNLNSENLSLFQL
ncbi:HAD superfamily hydrolase (TIGR01490 family) [Clostridium tetanomorphum]|uniref:phosphoserine phosphatase n=1 Tax=Clostridium tetanomorphum TaxID=1553 RepID=A0A923J129_CLOTT|nr:HAD-IB family hydrolase [Clostridium tetanomorphum]KAJ53518.1 phosphoserine phosphatase [Clostridium tetanomorphum DSM 665]MBC2396893.1 HAD-IB family hydrolase [Clostridium tetanomorphum]MBP1863144.1 HAD superfamily hydrolase (TIGR01490 family) [Clostridium tetanomorphum]NRS84252.1 HAD superfamily hydrolase (TIGR01490 family) [Clostridium tetanomorphum]NRZ97466.1 HAD superfamily hydrolase (TIGR01490 family) [Clostridium tetanomorphum]